MTPVVKICGLTRPGDAALAVDLGARYVGCVLASSSPRCVSAERARTVFDAIRGRAEPVLVFGATTLEEIQTAVRVAGVTHVQLHGGAEEQAVALEESGISVLRVRQVPERSEALPVLDPAPSERCLYVLDGPRGGSGRSFSWHILGAHAPGHVFVAGGVRAENLDRILARRPWGLDLSSGVEGVPGIKDPERLRTFFRTLEALT